MTRGRRKRHKRTCRRLILAFLVVIVAIIATAAIKGNTGQQEGQERVEIIETEVRLEVEKRAEGYLWSKGIYVYEYNEGIMRRMREIEEELRE